MIDVEWMIQYFPQLLTWPRVDMVRGHERGTPMAAKRNPVFTNVMHYSAPLPVMQSVTATRESCRQGDRKSQLERAAALAADCC